MRGCGVLCSTVSWLQKEVRFGVLPAALREAKMFLMWLQPATKFSIICEDDISAFA